MRRPLEWRLAWKDTTGQHREKTFADIDEMKQSRDALRAMQRVGLASGLSTAQRHPAIQATEWVQPDWVKAK